LKFIAILKLPSFVPFTGGITNLSSKPDLIYFSSINPSRDFPTILNDFNVNSTIHSAYFCYSF